MPRAARPAALTAVLALFLSSPACSGAQGGAVVHEPAEGEQFLRNIRQITFGGQNAEAYFSSDGRQLIFQRTESDSTCDQQYIINTDGSGLRRVSNGLGRTTCGYFYQNDRRIVYASTFESSTACPPPPDFSRGYVWALYEFDLFTSNADGSDLRRLTNSPGYDAEATLSPDGTRMVFTSTRDGDLELYTMGTDGSNVRRLTTTPGYDGGAFFSPDGTKIVYRAWHPADSADLASYQGLLAQRLVRPGRMELWVMNADGSDQRQITRLGGANFAPFFTPDGRRIIFSSNHRNPRSSNFDLFLVDLDGANLEQVTTSGTFDGFPQFSPDGTKLVWASNRHARLPNETNVFVADWVN